MKSAIRAGAGDAEGVRDRGSRGFALLGLLGALAAVVVLTAVATAWWLSSNVYAKPFEPTQLTEREERTLAGKLAKMDAAASSGDRRNVPADRGRDLPADEDLEPEPYSEDDAAREVRLSERELNALVARDGNVARRVAIDLSDDLVSVKLLVPIDPDFPLLGGKTLRFNFGVELGYAKGRPIVAMRGVSLGGVPVPSAWWGDIKNQNLVEKFGKEGGFWDHFARGVENIQVRDGHLWVQLKE